MTFGTNFDVKTGETTYLNGERVKVVSSDAGYVVVQDSNGNQHSVRKDVLMSTPLFKFYSEEARQEHKEKIEYYQQKGAEAGCLKNDWLSKVRDLWSKLSGMDKNDAEYAVIKDEYWNARFAKTAAGNAEYRYYLDAFMIASDPIA